MQEILTYYIQTICRWILRCGYSRGFGIQSPSAYSFVRYVINEHYPYYAYQQLDEDMKGKSRKFRKLGRLFFRISNYWQPQYVVLGDYAYAPYLYAGCNGTSVRMVDDCCLENVTRPVLVILDIDRMDDGNIREAILSSSSDRVLLVVIGICTNKKSKLLWSQLISDERIGVTYDLYHCGIVFFDKSKHKQDFKINF